MRLLDRSEVAVVPGDALGEHGEGLVGLSFAASREMLKTALGRIHGAISEFQRSV